MQRRFALPSRPPCVFTMCLHHVSAQDAAEADPFRWLAHHTRLCRHGGKDTASILTPPGTSDGSHLLGRRPSLSSLSPSPRQQVTLPFIVKTSWRIAHWRPHDVAWLTAGTCTVRRPPTAHTTRESRPRGRAVSSHVPPGCSLKPCAPWVQSQAMCPTGCSLKLCAPDWVQLRSQIALTACELSSYYLADAIPVRAVCAAAQGPKGDWRV